MLKFGERRGFVNKGSVDGGKMVKTRKDLTPRRNVRNSMSRTRPTNKVANIKVVVRVRPYNERETGENFRTVIKVVDEQLLIFDQEEDTTPFFYHGVQQKGRDLLKRANKNMKFNFDRVFVTESNNEEVFTNSTKSLISTLMDGSNCSVFVYGATGAGKTFTMLGNNDNPGITFLTMRELFKQKEALEAERDFDLAVSYLEVYNENVQDLLKPGAALHLREDGKVGVMVAGITLQRIENPEDLFELLERGNRCRTQHPTDANEESSRSHAVFQVYLRMNIKATQQTRLAKLSMIDLAGSERGAATGCKGARFTEGANINKSLLALGNCINSLADGQRHVPYRDSKLTRLLKDSLGGNCQTVMIANISPSSLCYEDTYNTLKYATRAKKIKANVKKNVVTGDSLSSAHYLKIIEELRDENVKLKAEKQEYLQQLQPQATQNVVIKDEIVLDDVCAEAKASLEALCAKKRDDLDRVHRLQLNRRVLEERICLKEETHRRVSVFMCNAPDKEREYQRLTATLDRLKRQTIVMKSDVVPLETRVEMVDAQIEALLEVNPALQPLLAHEQDMLQALATKIKLEEQQNIQRIMNKELQSRGAIMQSMAEVLKPYYLLLRASGQVTPSMTKEFEQLWTCVAGHCSVTFEDGDTPAAFTNAGIGSGDEGESRSALKRKLPPPHDDDVNTTFCVSSAATGSTLAAATVRNVVSAERFLGKAAAYQPSPAKRAACVKVRLCPAPAGAPSATNKENRIISRKVIAAKALGTMGTSSRFPSANVTAKQRNTRLQPMQRAKM